MKTTRANLYFEMTLLLLLLLPLPLLELPNFFANGGGGGPFSFFKCFVLLEFHLYFEMTLLLPLPLLKLPNFFAMEGGGGGFSFFKCFVFLWNCTQLRCAHPLHPPPRSAPEFNVKLGTNHALIISTIDDSYTCNVYTKLLCLLLGNRQTDN